VRERASVFISNVETRRAYLFVERNARAKRAYVIDELNLDSYNLSSLPQPVLSRSTCTQPGFIQPVLTRSTCTRSRLVPLPSTFARRAYRCLLVHTACSHSLISSGPRVCVCVAPCSSPINLRSPFIYSHARSQVRRWRESWELDW